MGYAQRAARAWAGLATAVAGLSAVAVFGFAAPAAADVSFDTEQAQRTGGARVAFKLTNDSPTATVTKFEVRFPSEYTIAETYPIAVAEWAPMITMKPVDSDPANDVPTAVVWTAMPGKEIKPGATSLLPLAMGPMPDAEFLYLDVFVTRSDGSVESWAGVDTPTSGAQHPAFAVKLIPLKPGEVPQVGHGGAADTDVAQTGATEPAAADPSSTDNDSSGSVRLAVVLLIIAALTGFALYWQRRRGATSAENDRLSRNGVGRKGNDRAEAADDGAPAARIPAQRRKGAPPKTAAAAKKAPAGAVSLADKPAAVQRRSVVRAAAAKKAAGRRTVVRKSTGGAGTVTLARRNGSASSAPGDTDGDNA